MNYTATLNQISGAIDNMEGITSSKSLLKARLESMMSQMSFENQLIGVIGKESHRVIEEVINELEHENQLLVFYEPNKGYKYPHEVLRDSMEEYVQANAKTQEQIKLLYFLEHAFTFNTVVHFFEELREKFGLQNKKTILWIEGEAGHFLWDRLHNAHELAKDGLIIIYSLPEDSKNILSQKTFEYRAKVFFEDFDNLIFTQ